MKKIRFSKVYGMVHLQVIRARARDLKRRRRVVKVKDIERKKVARQRKALGVMQGVKVMLNQSRVRRQVIQRMIVKMVKMNRKCQTLPGSASMILMKS